jgi:zinc protease
MGMAHGHRGSVIDSVQALFEIGTTGRLSEAQCLERFIVSGDESAFEAILARHGPMVLGVCRRVLGDQHDVDDAFQATFLILVQKARSIQKRAILGTWLHGVARRVAVRAKVNARRRQARERPCAQGANVDAEDPKPDDADLSELRSILDDQLGRLPERYRAPLVLCDLEGQTHEEAADQLRCPVGTIKSRLARGRERLRARLMRCGVAPSAVLFASAIAAGRASAVPAPLLDLTLRNASNFAAGRVVAAGAFSAEIATLMKEGVSTMILSKLKLSAIAALLIVVGVTGVRALVRQTPRENSLAGGQNAPTDEAIASRQGPIAKSNAGSRQAIASDASPKETNVTRFELENGLKVILRPIKGADQTVLVVLYSVGNDHDPEGQSGLGHLVEHLYLTSAAGTQKARTVEEFARRYPKGANGQTGDRYTMFATTFPEADLDRELEEAADRMGDLRLTSADLNREKPRLLEEIQNMFGNFPALAVQNQARELIRPTPRKGRHGGTPANVRALTLDDLRQRWQRYYKPRNAILSLSGSLDPVSAHKAIDARFAKLAAGAIAPSPAEPGAPATGSVKELSVKSPDPNAESMASLAYLAPLPNSELYAPFLVVVSRLWAEAGKLGGGDFGFPVFFTPLDDGAVVVISSPAQRGETSAKSFARLEAFVSETIKPNLRGNETAAVQEELGLFLNTIDIPDNLLAQNPYGTAFSLGRRAQMGLNSAKLKIAISNVTDQDLKKVAIEIFAPSRHAGAFIAVEK